MKGSADLKAKTPPPRPAFPAAMVLLFLAAALPSFGLTIHFKLSGSYGVLSFDDANRSLDGWRDYMKGKAAATPGWSHTGGREGRVRGAFGLEGEFLLGLTRRWAVGFGSGYAFSEASEAATALDITRSSVPYAYARPTKISATPLYLSGYHFFPLGGRLSLYLGAAAGRVRVRYSDGEAAKKRSSAGYTYSNEQSASGHGNLVQGVAGLKYAHDANLGLFLETAWRRARVDALGNGTGTLYIYEEYRPDADLWQARMSLLDAPPAGETFRSVRTAVMDYGGLVLKAGFLVKF